MVPTLTAMPAPSGNGFADTGTVFDPFDEVVP